MRLRLIGLWEGIGTKWLILRNDSVNPALICPFPEVKFHLCPVVDPFGMFDNNAVNVGKIDGTVRTCPNGGRAKPTVAAANKF